MPCYQAAAFPPSCCLPQETSLLLVPFNIDMNSVGKITDSTVSQRASPTAPAISPSGQKAAGQKVVRVKKRKIFANLNFSGGFFPPAQVVYSLLTKLTAQGSGRLSFVAGHIHFQIPKVSKFGLCSA